MPVTKTSVPTVDSERPLRVGDLVRLNSGGPNMTVTQVVDDGNASVAWIVEAMRMTASWQNSPSGIGVEYAIFPCACLSLIAVCKDGTP